MSSSDSPPSASPERAPRSSAGSDGGLSSADAESGSGARRASSDTAPPVAGAGAIPNHLADSEDEAHSHHSDDLLHHAAEALGEAPAPRPLAKRNSSSVSLSQALRNLAGGIVRGPASTASDPGDAPESFIFAAPTGSTPGGRYGRKRELKAPLTERDVSMMYSESNRSPFYYTQFRWPTREGAIDSARSLCRIVTWLPQYKFKESFASDLVSGLTLGFIVVPQALSYALLAELPPQMGLYSAIVAPLVYMLFGTSPLLHIGPFALISLLVSDTVGSVVDPGAHPAAYVQATLTTSLMTGVFLVIMSVLRIGAQIVDFLSNPVMSGLTTAGALIILSSQLRHFFGLPSSLVPRGDSFFVTTVQVIRALGETNLVAFAFGLSSLVVLLLVDHLNRRVARLKTFPIPGPLVVMVLSTLVSWALDLQSTADLAVLGDIPSGLPAPAAPDFANVDLLIVPSLVIAIVGFALSMATAKALAGSKASLVSANQELLALGLANIGGTFFWGYAAFASLSRSALLRTIGAASPLHNFFSALVVLLVTVFLAPVLSPMPYATLSAIIFVALRGLLLQLREPRRLWLMKRDLFVWLVTFFVTLGAGIVAGLVVGVVCSVLFLLHAVSRPHVATLGRLPDLPVYRNVKRYPASQEVPGVLILRFDSSLAFPNKDFFRKWFEAELLRRSGDERIHSIILDASSINSVDSSSLDELQNMLQILDTSMTEVILSNARGKFRDALSSRGISMPRFVSLDDAVEYAAGKRPIVRKPSVIAEGEHESSGDEEGEDGNGSSGSGAQGAHRADLRKAAAKHGNGPNGSAEPDVRVSEMAVV